MNEKRVNPETGLEIAVVGMAGRFPGADTIDEFWENLKNGVESLTFFSDDELEERGVDPALIKNPRFVKAKDLLNDIEHFDAAFFGYSAREAEVLNPQVRIFHECAWEALEDAGYNPETYNGRIGLYAGASSSAMWEGFLLLSGKADELGHFTAGVLTDKDYLCSSVSYKLNLKGPSSVVQTACSTSLVAVHWACRAVLSGECHMALAGGVGISAFQREGYMYEEGLIYSPDGHCRAFDAKANGTVGGEGIGIVLLKRLKRAAADGDHIYAVVKGSAINNDGNRKVGFTAPSVEGQAEVIRTALAMARVEPESIGYVETHGTGTNLGDPIEIEALKLAFQTDKSSDHLPIPIGSVKCNVGHLDAAAGIAGFIKVVLALKNKVIPPSINFETPNPKIDFAGGGFYVVDTLTPWKNDTYPLYPLRAGVSSFGIGGTNAHVVLEEAPAETAAPPRTGHDARGRDYHLILLSARSKRALEKAAENLSLHLGKNPGIHPADVAYTLQKGRKAFLYRQMAVCPDVETMIKALGKGPGEIPVSQAGSKERPIVFMFSGQGSQYIDMGRRLYEKEPVFREEIDRCSRILEPLSGESVKDILYPPPGADMGAAKEKIDDVIYSGPVKFSFEYAVAKLLVQWGIEPYAVIGHSFGEYAAACLSGIFSLEDAAELVVLRGKLMQETPPGAMLGVQLPEEELVPLLGDSLSLAAVNSPSHCIVSGPAAAVDHFEKQLTEKGHKCIYINFPRASHSKMMSAAAGEFKKAAGRITLGKPKIPYISGLTGKWLTADEAEDPGYWANHLQQPVRFSDGLTPLLKKPNTVFLQLSSDRGLPLFVGQHPDFKEENLVLNMVRHPKEETADDCYLYNQIGRLWSTGVEIDWASFHAGEKRRRIVLPSYPFERQRYWVDGDPLQAAANSSFAAVSRRKPDMADWFYTPSWKRAALPLKKSGGIHEHSRWLVFCDEAGLGLQLAERLKAGNAGNQTVIIVKKGPLFRGRDDNEFTLNPRENQGNGYDALFEELKRRDLLPDKIVHLWGVTDGGEKGMEKEWVEKIQDWGYYSLIHIAQAIGRIGLDKEVRVDVVTDSMQQVTGGDGRCPGKVTVLGPVKVIPIEYGNIRCRSIDVVFPGSIKEQTGPLVDQLLEELTAETSKRIETVAFRGGYRWVQTFSPVRLENPGKEGLPLREGGIYLITGGLGGIGLALAGYLAKSARAKLVLVDRSAFPPRDRWEEYAGDGAGGDTGGLGQNIREIRALEALGAGVLVFGADVADQDRMEEIMEQVEAQWGPLNGIIHAAGLPDGEMIQRRGRGSSEQVLGPKVHGTLVLDGLVKKRKIPLDFFVLCSSLNAFMATIGQVGYCAANAFLDAYADHTRSASGGGTFTVSINWERWQGVGMATAVEKMHHRLTGEELTGGIDAAEGVEIFHRILAHRLPRVAVSPVDMELLSERLGTLQAASLMEGIEGPAASKTVYRRPEMETEYVAPRNETERILVKIWQEYFGIEPIGIHDDFFALGGDSLKALIVLPKIHKELGVRLPITELFNKPTTAELAEYIAGDIAGDRLESIYVSIKPVEEREYYDLSPAQRRLYITQQLNPESVLYNQPNTVVLEGEPDRNRLEKALEKLIARHESLKTSFVVVDDAPVQRIHRDVAFDIQYYEARDLEQRTRIIENFVRPFDLSSAPLFRVGLIKTGEKEYLLLMDFHHITADGLSLDIFEKDFILLYAGRALPPLKIQYKDFSHWQNSEAASEAIKKQGDYWLKTFAGEIPVLDLPADYDNAETTRLTGEYVGFLVEEDSYGVLKELIKKTETTLFMVLLAIFNILLFKYTRLPDIVVGTPVTGRGHDDLHNIIGMFVNMLAMRNTPRNETTFNEFLREVKQNALAAFENQDFQFDELVRKLGAERDSEKNPLFNTVLAMQNYNTGEDVNMMLPEESGELRLKPYEFENKALRFDLTLFVSEVNDRLHMQYRYSTGLFKEETVERFAEHYIEILEQVIENPGITLKQVRLSSDLLKAGFVTEEEDVDFGF